MYAAAHSLPLEPPTQASGEDAEDSPTTYLERLESVDARLSRLEQSLNAQLALTGLSLFPSLSPPAPSDCSPSVSQYDVTTTEEGVRHLSLSSLALSSPSPSPPSPTSPASTYRALVIPYTSDDDTSFFASPDSALSQISSLMNSSSSSDDSFFFDNLFYTPPQPPTSLFAPPATCATELEDEIEWRGAELLCGLRKTHHFASMALFPELAEPFPPSPPSLWHPGEEHYPSSSPDTSHPSSPYFSSSPASPAESWTTAGSPCSSCSSP
ncbi:hypothetical protein JCM8547_002117 [Rhodosporidiobolus lusitaniae]